MIDVPIGPFAELREGLDAVSGALSYLNSIEISPRRDMSDAEQEALDEYLAQLPGIVREMNQLKRTLQEDEQIQRPGKKRKQKEQENVLPLPLPGEKVPNVRSPSYHDEVMGFKGAERFSFREFVYRTCGSNPFPCSLDHAFKCAVAGFNDTPGTTSMITLMDKYTLYDDEASLLNLVCDANNVPPGTDQEQLSYLYSIIKKQGNFLSEGTRPWLKHICCIMVHLRFALKWREHGGRGTDADARKKTAREAIYKPKGPMTEVERESTNYKKWLGRFNPRRTACTRLLEAYEVFGSIVILHPGFSYQAFQCSRKGPGIGDLLEMAPDQLREDNPIPGNEITNRALTRSVLDYLVEPDTEGDSTKSCLELFGLIEQQVDRSFIGLLPMA